MSSEDEEFKFCNKYHIQNKISYEVLNVGEATTTKKKASEKSS